MPFELWNWADTAGAPREIMDQWRNRDIRADIQALCSFPVYLQNDATAACGAELVFGQTGNLRDFIYFYIGAFAGGGVVLNGRLYSGPTGNAGALGSMPVPGADGRPTQLIDVASLAILEKATERARASMPPICGHRPRTGTATAPEFEAWFATRRRRARLRHRRGILGHRFRGGGHRRLDAGAGGGGLVDAVQQALARIDVEGLQIPAVREGTVGIHARALGGASLPLSERFLIGARRAAKGPIGMLIGIPALLGPEFLATLRAMGHGDETRDRRRQTTRPKSTAERACAPTATG